MNLETKFGTLETQLAQQHQATLIAINALLAALGAPPPEPGATLADVLGALNQIAVELSSLTTAITTQHAAQLAKLTDIWTTLDLLNNNNALNTQLLLTALAANNCCTPTGAALPLPLLTNPTSLADQEKCRRIQFYLAWFGGWLDNIATFGGLSSQLTGATLATLLATAIPAGTVIGGEIGAVGGIPGAVVGAILGLLVSAFYTIGATLIGTLSTQWHTAPLYDQLLHALYQANDAASGYAAFQSTVSASGVLNPVWKGVINALFWTGWANDIYSSTPVVDDSGFDGSICAPANTACVQMASQSVAFSAASPWFALVFTGQLGIIGETHDARGNTSDSQIWFKPPINCYVRLLSGTASLFAQGEQPLTINVPVGLLGGGEPSGHPYSIGSPSGNFTAEVCPGNPPS